MILRSVSAHTAFRWAVDGDYNAPNIANFLILDARLPRSLAYCASQMVGNLEYLAQDYGNRTHSLVMAEELNTRLKTNDINSIFDEGLHEFLTSFIADTAALGQQIEQDYRFNA